MTGRYRPLKRLKAAAPAGGRRRQSEEKMATREILDEQESYGESPGRALGMGAAVGIGVFLLGALVLAPILDWENPNGMTAVGAAVAASLATLKMGSHLGRVVKLGIMAFIGSSLLFWFVGCTLGLLIFSGADVNWATPTPNSPEITQAFQALDLWSFLLSIILIGLAAVVGVACWEQDPDG